MVRWVWRRMFEGFEVGAEVSKQDYESVVPDLRVELVNMQYDLQQADFAVLVVLAGDDRKDANEMLDVLHEWLDARYLHTHVFLLPRQEELEYPDYWRYWRAMPPDGRIGIHAGAWPLRALAERILEEGSRSKLDRRIERMKALERCLADDGTVLVKLWLHLPAKQAKKRLKKAKKDPDREPYVGKEDWEIYERRDETMPVAERLLRETHTPWAPWSIVESSNSRHRNLEVARTILQAVRQRLDGGPARRSEGAPVAPRPSGSKVRTLEDVDLGASLEREEYRERMVELQGELARRVRKARGRVATVLAFEGWDAAGKGGVIRRLTQAIFARDYRVIPIAAPTDEERTHHYLWRFWRRIPRNGEMAIFDRSWYGRVLVERVEGYATEAEWRRAYAEINDFEAQLVDHGMVFCKFWLHLDPDEQLRRFQAREKTSYKKYKITDDDYRNREKWSAYTEAVDEMVARTSTEAAPWHLVAANDKKWARIQVLDRVVRALEARV
jgi:polyphosphate:AMP phosphotransferase